MHWLCCLCFTLLAIIQSSHTFSLSPVPIPQEAPQRLSSTMSEETSFLFTSESVNEGHPGKLTLSVASVRGVSGGIGSWQRRCGCAGTQHVKRRSPTLTGQQQYMTYSGGSRVQTRKGKLGDSCRRRYTIFTIFLGRYQDSITPTALLRPVFSKPGLEPYLRKTPRHGLNFVF